MTPKTLMALSATMLFSVTAPVSAGLLDDAGQTTTGSEAVEAGDSIPGRYIIQVDSNIAEILGVGTLEDSIQRLLMAVGGGEVDHLYDTALNGAAVQLTDTQAQLLQSLPGVLHVEPDSVVLAGDTQSDPTWGLDRVDQPFLPLDDQYVYPTDGTDTVSVYVIDTGLRSTHLEFTGRVIEGRNFASHSSSLFGIGGGFLLGGSVDANDTSDCNGHGTHVSSTAVGTTYGVAKDAQVSPVRVLDCSGAGSISDVIAGVDWVAENHQKPAVANMSLGGGDSDSLDQAVRNAVADGVTFVVAAGNSDADACSGSPNRLDEAVTVGSTNREDQRSSFSNHGSCVDIFAPGSNIKAAWYESDTQTNTISGTSMASPHVAGAAALLLDDDQSLTPAQVQKALVDQATGGVLSGIESGSPNLLLRVETP